MKKNYFWGWPWILPHWLGCRLIKKYVPLIFQVIQSFPTSIISVGYTSSDFLLNKDKDFLNYLLMPSRFGWSGFQFVPNISAQVHWFRLRRINAMATFGKNLKYSESQINLGIITMKMTSTPSNSFRKPLRIHNEKLWVLNCSLEDLFHHFSFLYSQFHKKKLLSGILWNNEPFCLNI